MFTKSKILQGIADRLHFLRISTLGDKDSQYWKDASMNLKEDNASVKSYLNDDKVGEKKGASQYYNETNRNYGIKAEDDFEILMGWNQYPTNWDEAYYAGDRKDSPKNMEFSDAEASYWAEPSTLLNFTAALANSERFQRNGGEVSNKSLDTQREMIERIVSEGANTQATINEAYRRIGYILKNEPDNPAAKDAIASYGEAINKLEKLEANCVSPYAKVRDLLYQKKNWGKSKGSMAEKLYNKTCDELNNYQDPQFCEDNGLDYDLVQEYIQSWVSNRSLEARVKRQLAEARKARESQATKGEKGEKIDN